MFESHDEIHSWDIPSSAANISTLAIFAQAQQLMQTGTPLVALDEGADAALAGAARVLDLNYDVPYLAHATMEVMNCTANVTASACEIWRSGPRSAASSARLPRSRARRRRRCACIASPA